MSNGVQNTELTTINDLQGSAVVNSAVYQEWLASVGGATSPAADVNKDGVVDGGDYLSSLLASDNDAGTDNLHWFDGLGFFDDGRDTSGMNLNPIVLHEQDDVTFTPIEDTVVSLPANNNDPANDVTVSPTVSNAATTLF